MEVPSENFGDVAESNGCFDDIDGMLNCVFDILFITTYVSLPKK